MFWKYVVVIMYERTGEVWKVCVWSTEYARVWGSTGEVIYIWLVSSELKNKYGRRKWKLEVENIVMSMFHNFLWTKIYKRFCSLVDKNFINLSESRREAASESSPWHVKEVWKVLWEWIDLKVILTQEPKWLRTGRPVQKILFVGVHFPGLRLRGVCEPRGAGRRVVAP